ncbi:MarR family winged helix-turn-helix transcriptional regulator [Hoyosella altamirensis]|uniref:DNA-binding MarR family transcriptional regulator n=1 Tax=Hoyosella altamirensis TaxID=616997 RepID=A0A839RIR4_9ACTN|nr:MarR family transcriptional regulator [Hoyosella altamirensis]MBB3036555.1 DNA-binding MarR family transcriptional regulator [Hoyosella altamirensis]
MANDELPVGLLMFISFRYLEGRVHEALEAAGYGDVSIAQGRVAARIAPGGSRLTDIAEQAQITKQTAGFLVDQLEKSGIVERVSDPMDKRARLVRFTERGKKLSATADAAVAEVEAEWVAHLGKRHMDQLRRALSELREVTDPYM